MSELDIPQCWTADEALLVTAFLDEIARAIWNRHGRKMALVLQGIEQPVPNPPHPDDEHSCASFKDDIPF